MIFILMPHYTYILYRNGVRGVMKRIGNMFGSSSESDKIEENRDKLRDLQVKMYALEDLLTNHHITQFVVVSIPTQVYHTTHTPLPMPFSPFSLYLSQCSSLSRTVLDIGV